LFHAVTKMQAAKVVALATAVGKEEEMVEEEQEEAGD